MRKFNLVASGKGSLRASLNYIQVKNGFVYATDCHKLVKVPIKEAFGSLPAHAPEEFYFKAEAWKKGNFYKALYYNIKDNYLEAFDKKGKMGIIDILTHEQFRAEVGGNFPDCESVLPADEKPTEAVDLISFNPSYLQDLCEVFNQPTNNFIFTFFGKTKAIKVTYKDMEGFGIIMPIAMND
jgi:hypothetical protein